MVIWDKNFIQDRFIPHTPSLLAMHIYNCCVRECAQDVLNYCVLLFTLSRPHTLPTVWLFYPSQLGNLAERARPPLHAHLHMYMYLFPIPTPTAACTCMYIHVRYMTYIGLRGNWFIAGKRVPNNYIQGSVYSLNPIHLNFTKVPTQNEMAALISSCGTL